MIDILKFLSVVLTSVAAIYIYRSMRKTRQKEMRVFKKPKKLSQCPTKFTLESLAEFTGTNIDMGYPIYISLKGVVFDVTSHSTGWDLYGPQAAYYLFAGKDATIALATMALESNVLNSSDFSSLTVSQRTTLDSWFERYMSKYDVVGYLDTFFVGNFDTIYKENQCK